MLPVQANATNTVALWPGQLTSLLTLRGDVRRDLLVVIAATSVVGGTTGAWVLLHTRQRTFLHMIPWLLLSGALIFWVSAPVSRWLRARSKKSVEELATWRAPGFVPLFCALFPVCFYIGYFGAGGGFLIMTILALFGLEEMYALNAMKVVAACLSNLCAIVTFIARGAVEWRYCVVSMVFAAGGRVPGGEVCTADEPGGAADGGGGDGMRDGGVLLLEAAMTPRAGSWVEMIGFCAAFCTTVAFVPQLWRVVRLRSARDISLPTFLLFSVGVFLWLLYGIYTGSTPVIVSNGATLVLSVSILALKVRYDRRAMEEVKL